jgi:hypothetical protein
MVAQFIRLTVDDEADTTQLQQSLEQEGARVRWHEATLQVLWPEPDAARIRSWLEGINGRVSVLDERPVQVADGFLPPTPSR